MRMIREGRRDWLSCPAKAGLPVRRGLSAQSPTSLEYWIARSSRAMTIESAAPSSLLHPERDPRVVLQPLDQLALHRSSRRPESGRDIRRVAQQADRAFRDHLRGRAIARVAVTLHCGPHLPAVRRDRDIEKIVKTVLAFLFRRALARLR